MTREQLHFEILRRFLVRTPRDPPLIHSTRVRRARSGWWNTHPGRCLPQYTRWERRGSCAPFAEPHIPSLRSESGGRTPLPQSHSPRGFSADPAPCRWSFRRYSKRSGWSAGRDCSTRGRPRRDRQWREERWPWLLVRTDELLPARLSDHHLNTCCRGWACQVICVRVIVLHVSLIAYRMNKIKRRSYCSTLWSSILAKFPEVSTS